MAKKVEKRGFGSIRKLPSGRYQARYTGPAGETVSAPTTFSARLDAEGWLQEERKHVERPESWLAPLERLTAARTAAAKTRKPTFREYADVWLTTRMVRGRPLQPSTARGYRIWLDRYLLPAFGEIELDAITPADVIAWHRSMDQSKRKTLKEAYSLGSAIMRSATSADGVIPGTVNPFAIDGAGSVGARSAKREELVEDEELTRILQVIREEWRALVWLALGCGLRFGEATALRRTRDLDLKATPSPIIKVRYAIGTGDKGVRYEKPPKSDAGIRDQRIPSPVLAALKVHLRTHVTGRDGLLFPAPEGGWLTSSRFHETSGGWHDVRTALHRPTLNFHDLRATGATRMARAGANVAEVQAFLGDSTPTAAMRYVRAAQSRMDDLTVAAFASLTLPRAT